MLVWIDRVGVGFANEIAWEGESCMICCWGGVGTLRMEETDSNPRSQRDWRLSTFLFGANLASTARRRNLVAKGPVSALKANRRFFPAGLGVGRRTMQTRQKKTIRASIHRVAATDPRYLFCCSCAGPCGGTLCCRVIPPVLAQHCVSLVRGLFVFRYPCPTLPYHRFLYPFSPRLAMPQDQVVLSFAARLTALQFLIVQGVGVYDFVAVICLDSHTPPVRAVPTPSSHNASHICTTGPCACVQVRFRYLCQFASALFAHHVSCAVLRPAACDGASISFRSSQWSQASWSVTCVRPLPRT